MNRKIIALFLIMAVLGTVFVSGCVTDTGTQDSEQQEQESALLSEADDVWVNESDDVVIGEMY
jgi:hypothetical protein